MMLHALSSTLNDGEVEALQWWRAETSREIDRLITLQKAASQARAFDMAKIWGADVKAQQRLQKAINLFWAWLAGPPGKPQAPSRWPPELAEEITQVDYVLSYGVAPNLLPDLFPGVCCASEIGS